MDRKVTKTVIAAFGAGLLLALTSGLSYAGASSSSFCWGSCAGSTAMAPSGAAAHNINGSATASTPSYSGAWGFDFSSYHGFVPSHRSEILTYAPAYGADWTTDLNTHGYASTHAKMSLHTN